MIVTLFRISSISELAKQLRIVGIMLAVAEDISNNTGSIQINDLPFAKMIYLFKVLMKKHKKKLLLIWLIVYLLMLSLEFILAHR